MKYPLLFHLIGWVGLCVLFFILFPLMYPVVLPIEHYIYHLILLLCCIVIYYANSLLILPYVRWRKNAIVYALVLLVLTAVLIFVMGKVENYLDLNLKIHQALHPNQAFLSTRNSFFIAVYLSIFALMIYGIGIAESLVSQWNKNERIQLQLQQEKAQAELATLKAQINPHFIFNTLNTIHGLSYMDVEDSRKALVDLSKMMRYMMNEDQQENVALKDEIQFIEHYIDLMKFRLPTTMTLEVTIDPIKKDYRIAPMILLTFIENVFKHGVSTDKSAKISIKITIVEDVLYLGLKNEIFKLRIGITSKGIGIANTHKRLNLLYLNRHTYKSNIIDNQYICELTINLVS